MNEEIKKEIDFLKSRIEKLEAELNKSETDEWLKIKDKYWRISGYGSIDRFDFMDDENDNGAKFIGNIFRTKKQAERRLEQLKLIQELREFGGDGEFYLYFDAVEKKWDWNYGYSGLVQFPSKQKTLEAIKHFGDRLNILLPQK